LSGSASLSELSSMSDMSDDISERNGVMPTPAPTATRIGRDRALCVGAA